MHSSLAVDAFEHLEQTIPMCQVVLDQFWQQQNIDPGMLGVGDEILAHVNQVEQARR
jgi:hypothetical protein